jgi:histidinol-phosphate aminotransferase
VAAAAAIAALDDHEFVEKCRRENAAGRVVLGEGFRRLGLPFVPGGGNFLLVKVGDGAAVFAALQARGIITRPVKPYGLPEWLRITVGTRAQNDRLLEGLIQILQK